MLRIHFTAADLLETRYAMRPSPLLELTTAIAMLQRRDTLFDAWRKETAAKIPRAARLLFQLIPPSATGPLFLDPATDDFTAGLDLVLTTPRPLVRAQLTRADNAERAVTPWLRGLYDRDGEAWRMLADAMTAAYHHILSPSWPRVQAGFRADIGLRGRLTAEGGIRASLEGMYPDTHWRGTTLCVHRPTTLDVHPEGRGVTFLPLVCWSGFPLVTDHPDGSVLIVYPACTSLPLTAADPVDDSLRALLGPTRAGILALAAGRRSTSELADELEISAASASTHTRTLRAAGLLTTTRDGKTAVHSLTPLGQRLLLAG